MKASIALMLSLVAVLTACERQTVPTETIELKSPPALIAGNRQCNENRSCRGHRNQCRIVEDILKHAQLVRAARTRISPHLCARSEPGGFLRRRDAGMTVARDLSAPRTSPAIFAGASMSAAN